MISRQLGLRGCRAYLLVCEKTKAAALVDPLLEQVELYGELVKREGLKLACVIDTHTHADHLSGGSALRGRAPYLMHESSKVSSVTRRVADGETVGVGGFAITFLHTPGHTADSMTLVLDDRLLSGDFLFSGPDGAGRLDFPGSDPAAHFESLRRIDALRDDLLLFPAHEYAGRIGATLGAERLVNPVLSPRSREAYLKWWEARRPVPAPWMEKVVLANLAGTVDRNAVSIPQDVAACACAAGPMPSHDDIPSISSQDLERKLRLAPGSVGLLDVRTSEEFNDELGHIDGAVLIPIDELAGRLEEVPNGPLAVICRSGKRAARAATLLRDSGRAELWVLEGGMLAWNERPGR